MSRPRFLADHDFNEHIVDGVLRGVNQRSRSFGRGTRGCERSPTSA